MNPYLAGAVLVSELRNAGYDASCLDMNVKFFNDILTKENVLECASSALLKFEKSKKYAFEYGGRLSEFASFPAEVKTELLRYRDISSFFSKEDAEEFIKETAEKIEDAVAIHKDRERFYNPELLFRAKGTVDDALRIISLKYAPTKILIDNYIADPAVDYSYENVKRQCYDSDINMFIDYFEKYFDFDNIKNYSLAGISVSDLSQLVPAMTLGRMLKEKTDVKVAFGGNYVYKIIGDIKKQPEFFELFCDYITVGDGETASVSLASFMGGEIPIEKVYSLVWKNEKGEIITNETAPLLKMDALSVPDFSDYDFSQYFSPDTVIPVQLGKGCYWGKCAFCDFYTGQQKFDIKGVIHAADEVEELYNKYGARHFVFVDECVPPKFYEKLADEILRREIKIYFYSFARFDNGFTREVLEKLYKAGARYFSWGYEAKSERLLKLMNKCIDPEVRVRILRDSCEIGMWNQCTFLLGYPTETPEELKSTIDVINDRELIHSCTPSNFALKKNAILGSEPETVGLSNITTKGDFHISFNYDSKGISMDEVKKNRLTFEQKFLTDTADTLWSLGFTDTDHLLLYVSKYGRDYVKDYRLSFKKKYNFQ